MGFLQHVLLNQSIWRFHILSYPYCSCWLGVSGRRGTPKLPPYYRQWQLRYLGGSVNGGTPIYSKIRPFGSGNLNVLGIPHSRKPPQYEYIYIYICIVYIILHHIYIYNNNNSNNNHHHHRPRDLWVSLFWSIINPYGSHLRFSRAEPRSSRYQRRLSFLSLYASYAVLKDAPSAVETEKSRHWLMICYMENHHD